MINLMKEQCWTEVLNLQPPDYQSGSSYWTTGPGPNGYELLTKGEYMLKIEMGTQLLPHNTYRFNSVIN